MINRKLYIDFTTEKLKKKNEKLFSDFEKITLETIVYKYVIRNLFKTHADTYTHSHTQKKLKTN